MTALRPRASDPCQSPGKPRLWRRARSGRRLL